MEAEVDRLGKALAEADQHNQEAQTMLQTALPLQAVQVRADPAWLKEPPALPR